MTLSVGDSLPDATLMRTGADGPETLLLSSLTKGRKVVLFGLPGAFTRTCTAAHLPSFMRTKSDFEAKGVDEIICVSVNDPFVMAAWGEATGAAEAGLTLLGDGNAELTQAMGLAFDVPALGFVNRSKRYALYAEDNVVKVFHLEEGTGCTISAGESLLAEI